MHSKYPSAPITSSVRDSPTFIVEVFSLKLISREPTFKPYVNLLLSLVIVKVVKPAFLAYIIPFDIVAIDVSSILKLYFDKHKSDKFELSFIVESVIILIVLVANLKSSQTLTYNFLLLLDVLISISSYPAFLAV